MPKVKKNDIEALGFRRGEGANYYYHPDTSKTRVRLNVTGAGFPHFDVQFIEVESHGEATRLGFSPIIREFQAYKLDSIKLKESALSDIRRTIDKLNGMLAR